MCILPRCLCLYMCFPVAGMVIPVDCVGIILKIFQNPKVPMGTILYCYATWATLRHIDPSREPLNMGVSRNREFFVTLGICGHQQGLY